MLKKSQTCQEQLKLILIGISDLIDLFQECASAPIDNRISLHVTRLIERCFNTLNTTDYLTKYQAIALWNAYIFFNENELIDDKSAITYMHKLNNSCDEDELSPADYQSISHEALYLPLSLCKRPVNAVL